MILTLSKRFIIPSKLAIGGETLSFGFQRNQGINLLASSPLLDRDLCEYQLRRRKAFSSSASSWERAKTVVWQTALARLLQKTDILERAIEHSSSVDAVLKQILATLAFVPPKTMSMSNPKPPRSNYVARTRIGAGLLTIRSYHTASDFSRWKISSTAAASEVLPGLERTQSEDAKLLVVLLCFLANFDVPLDLLYRGASPRKRWDEFGRIEETDALHLGLFPELARICSYKTTLNHALSQLQSSLAISRISEHTLRVDQSVLAAMTTRIPVEFHPTWRLQAFIIAYRSIPWKYLETR
jgi:hypothetical protein